MTTAQESSAPTASPAPTGSARPTAAADKVADKTADNTADNTADKHADNAGAVHVVLVPGFWLGGWAWDEVVPTLQAAGLIAHPVTLPGLDPADASRAGTITREDTVAAVEELIAGLSGDIVLVGHSGGGPTIQQVADRDPGRFRRLIFVDSGPLIDGSVLSAPVDAETIPLPDWQELAEQGSSVEGIDEAGLARFRERAVPQPAAVAIAPIRVSDPDRFGIPVTAICTSFPAATLRQIATPDGPLHAELLQYDVTWVDLPTGHWPMFSRPADLGAAIAAAARDE